MLEVVVVVGIILIIVIGFIFGYSSVAENGRKAAVESAANVVVKGIAVKASNESLKDPQNVADEWMNSAQKSNKINITAIRNIDQITVTAIYDNNDKIKAIRSFSLRNFSNNYNDKEENNDGIGNEENERLDEKISTFIYKCTVDSKGPLAIAGFSNKAKITMTGDGKNKTVGISKNSGNTFKPYVNLVKGKIYHDSRGASYNNNFSDEVEMKAGVEYKITIEGGFDFLGAIVDTNKFDVDKDSLSQLNQPSACVTSISDLGEESGVKQISFIDSGKGTFENVPNQIPSSLISIQDMFRGAHIFNDPNIKDWDTSNIRYMRGAFAEATAFNQNIEKWDVSKIMDMDYLFHNAENFNQPLNDWDVSSVKYMNHMFNNAKKFDKPLNKWNTESSQNMSYMFSGADSFSHVINNWNIKKVKNWNDFSKNANRLTNDKIPSKFRD